MFFGIECGGPLTRGRAEPVIGYNLSSIEIDDNLGPYLIFDLGRLFKCSSKVNFSSAAEVDEYFRNVWPLIQVVLAEFSAVFESKNRNSLNHVTSS